MRTLMLRDEKGQATVEYAIVAAALIAVAVILSAYFPADIFGGWLKAARRGVLVSVNDLSDARSLAREIGDR